MPPCPARPPRCTGTQAGHRPGSPGRESGDPPGGGPIDPATGIREWYDPHPQGSAEGDGHTWADIFEHWQLIEDDLQELYGIDVESGILRARSWRWLRVRIVGLLSCESRLARILTPGPKASSTWFRSAHE